MKELHITLNDFDLWVEYEYTQGERPDRNNPGYPATVTIHNIYVDGTDWNITQEVSASEEEQIEQILLDHEENS